MSVLELVEQYIRLVDWPQFVMNTVLAACSIRLSISWFHFRYARLAFLVTGLSGVLGLLYHQLEPLTDLSSLKISKNLLQRFSRLLFLPLLTLQLYTQHGHQDVLTVCLTLGPTCVLLVTGAGCLLDSVMVYNAWLFLISVDSTLHCSLLGLVSLLMYFVVEFNSFLYLLVNVLVVLAANSCLHNLPPVKYAP